jgi:hypothetical protein
MDSGLFPDTGGHDGGSQLDANEDTNTAETSAPDTGVPDANGADGGCVDDGTFGTVTAAANGAQFSTPFDSTPDPTGQTVYFTGLDPDGASGIFSVKAAGSATPTKLFAGAPLSSPFGIAISDDGTTLYVADLGADNGTDQGGIFSLSVSAGTPTLLAGTDAYLPRSLEVVGGTLYFTGIDKANGSAGVFSMPVAGGTVTTVAEGAPFVDPSGVTADGTGTVYVLDAVGSGPGTGVVIKVASGGAAVLGSPLSVGYPAGITLSGDGMTLLASSLGASGADQVLSIEVGSGASTAHTTGAIGSNYEAAGLHRSHRACAYSWVDSAAGGTGTVYLLTP